MCLWNASLLDMNVNVAAQDSRHIEVLSQDLPCHGGVQFGSRHHAGRSPPTRDGAVLLQARQDKETTYREVASSGCCMLAVLGGGARKTCRR